MGIVATTIWDCFSADVGPRESAAFKADIASGTADGDVGYTWCSVEFEVDFKGECETGFRRCEWGCLVWHSTVNHVVEDTVLV